MGSSGVACLYIISSPRHVWRCSGWEWSDHSRKSDHWAGYAAQGAQTGLTVGFMGIGLSYALPGFTYYGCIGYALFASTAAENLQYYPLNTAPVISDISPANGQQNVSLSVSELQFRMRMLTLIL